MKRRLLAILSVVVTVGALAWIVWKIDLAQAGQALGRVGLRGGAAFLAATLATLFFQSLGWHVLFRSRGWPISFRSTFEAMLMGNAVSYVTPSMYLGGEPLRIWIIGERYNLKKRDVTATVLVQKFSEFAGFVLVLLVSIGLMFWNFDLSPTLRWSAIAASALLSVVFLVLLFAFVGRWPVASTIIGWFGPRAAGLREKARETEAQVEQTFHKTPGAAAACLFLTGSPALLIAARPLFYFVFTGHAVTIPELALIFVFTQVLLAFQFTPGGLGIFEGGLIGTFALIGLEAPEAVAFSAIQRVTDVVLVGTGFLLAAREGLTGFFRGKKPEETTPTG